MKVSVILSLVAIAASAFAHPSVYKPPVVSLKEVEAIRKAGGYGNPFEGVKWFLDPAYAVKVKGSVKLQKNITAIANKFLKHPTALWASKIADLEKIPEQLHQAEKQLKYVPNGQDLLVQYVIYDLPGRDCAAKASAGELQLGPQGMKTYKRKFIDAFFNAVVYRNPRIRLVLYIEPDSLPNLVTNTQSSKACFDAIDAYQEGIAYAISKLSILRNTYVYGDVAHGGWLGWDANSVGIGELFKNVTAAAKKIDARAQLTGFVSSVSNYNAFKSNGAAPAKDGAVEIIDGIPRFQWNSAIDEDTFTKNLAKIFAPLGLPPKFVIETARAGQVGSRSAWSNWCNIKSAGVGPRPQANPEGSPHVHALAWVKPPGESDGVSDPNAPRFDENCVSVDAAPGAPQAGEWFHANFVQLLTLANPPL